MTQKILTVFGATGNQGGSILSVIFGHPALSSKYKVRAITRDPSKPSAQGLASKGAELAKADMNDVASLRAAVAGSYGVFAVTNYWESMSKDIERQQGKNVVDACKAEGVKHLVFSSLPNVTKLTQGELTKVEHFDAKAEVADYAEQVKGDMIASYFMPAFFMSNLPTWIKKDGNVFTISRPWEPTQTWLPLLDIQGDTGLFVAGLFEAESKANGVFVQGVSQWVHPKQVTDTISEITGQEVQFVEQPATVETVAKIGDRIGEELQENMLLIRDFSYFGKGSEQKQSESDKFLLPDSKTTSFKEFAQKTKWNI